MIYIDELVFLNFVIDYILLKTLSRILKINTKNYRIFLSCLVGEISILFLFLECSNYILFFFKILLCVLMIIVCFNYNDYKTLIKNSIYYYLLSFFLGGSLYYLKIENLVNYKYILLLIPIIMNIYEYFEYDIKNIIRTKYKVTIYLNDGKILYLNGFMDTGNSLVEPYGNRKVIIINKKVNEKYFLVPYKTINDEALIKCFNPKKVYIDGIGERDDISIGIINKKFIGYNCLLNCKLMEEE